MKRASAPEKRRGEHKKLRTSETDEEYKFLLPEVEDEDYTQTQNQSAVPQLAATDADELSLEQTMTADEINDHVRTCLKLSSENKITPKNAFALQLIDCLRYLADKKKDFSTMACSLDAGAKIYSYRVDALHQQVITLAEEVMINLRHNSIDEDDGPQTSGRRFSRKSRGILTTNENIVRKLKMKDPKDKYLKVTALPGAIISGVTLDQKDLSFTLEKKIPFWADYANYSPTRAEGLVTLPKIEVVRDSSRITCFESNIQDYVSHRRESENKTEEIPFSETDCDGPADTQISETGHEITNLPEGDPQSPTIDPSDSSDREDTGGREGDEVEVLATAMNRINKEAEDGICPLPSRAEAIKMLFDNTSEYHYLKMDNAKYWAGPEYWTRHHQGPTLAEKGIRGRKKKQPGTIDYDADLELNWNKGFKLSSKLVCNKLQSWKPSSITTPKDFSYELDTFMDLFHMCLKEINKNESEFDLSGPQGLDELVDLENGSSNIPEEDEDEHGPLNSLHHHDDAVYDEHSVSSRDSHVDVGDYSCDIPSSDLDINGIPGRLIKINVENDSTPGYDGASMVPAPKMVTVKPIQFKSRPIRVNMRHLKEVMLDQIKKDFEKDRRQQTTFSRLFREIPPRLEKTTATDLTPSLAYMALLILANENNFRIKSCDNYKDVTVTMMDENCNRTRREENNKLDHYIVDMVNKSSGSANE